jgi:LAO/AO transport system kinase
MPRKRVISRTAAPISARASRATQAAIDTTVQLTLAAQPSVAAHLAEKVRQGDMRSLARAASLIENQTSDGRELIRLLFPYTGQALIVGITGPSGAGKSTLVNQLVRLARSRQQQVGILAVDPSSPFSSGAILGDRIRMQEHHADPGVFLRSLATRGRMGGVAAPTLELALLLDAAGRDLVFIETVGVGQDEIEISRLADVTVVVLAPGFGDDVQAMKAGIMEVADVFAVNKADLVGADRLQQEIRAMQSFAEPSLAEPAPVCPVVSSDGTGVSELWAMVEKVFSEKGRLQRRAEIWEVRLRELLRDRLLATLDSKALLQHATAVAEKNEDPFQAVDSLMAGLLLTSALRREGT